MIKFGGMLTLLLLKPIINFFIGLKLALLYLWNDMNDDYVNLIFAGFFLTNFPSLPSV